MGAAFAPNYANLFMGHWEEKFINNPTVNPFFTKIALYCRYIDDILLIWNGSDEEFVSFVHYVNNTENNLTFTDEHSLISVNFLDLMICKTSENTLETTKYQKPLSRNTLLHADSNRPVQLQRNIPMGQFLRLRRNCSSPEEFKSKKFS